MVGISDQIASTDGKYGEKFLPMNHQGIKNANETPVLPEFLNLLRCM